MDYQTIRERYYYKDGHLYYRENLSARARKDDRVGTISGNERECLCTYVKVCGLPRYHYQLSRLIYCYHNQCGYFDIDGWDVDHLNNNSLDNRIENLCLCEHWENQLNRKDTKRNGGLHPLWEQQTVYNRTIRRERRRLKTHHITKNDKDT